MRIAAILGLLLAVISPGLAYPVDSRVDGEQPVAGGLEHVFAESCRTAAPPGAVLALRQPGQPPVFLAHGVADLESQTPLGINQQLPIGSITKLFTAVIVLQLVEEGLIALDAPVAAFFPELPHAERITVRHLLNHSSGIYDYAELKQDVPLPMVALALAYRWDPYQVVAGALARELYFPPGTGFHYSNTNYFLLGLIVEQVTGNDMADEYRTRISEPLGLANTYLISAERRPVVHGYLWENKGYRDSTMLENPTLAWTAGGLASNTSDLLVFAASLFEGDLLTAGSRQEMLATVLRPQFGGYGLGVMDVNAEGVHLLGHGGWTLAFRTGLWYLPEQGIYLACLTNLATCDIWEINAAVLRWALEYP